MSLGQVSMETSSCPAGQMDANNFWEIVTSMLISSQVRSLAWPVPGISPNRRTQGLSMFSSRSLIMGLK